MKIVFLLASSVIATFSILFPAEAATLAVVGKSDVEAMPDTASLTFNVSTKNKDAVKAQAENVAITKKLIANFNAVGIKASDIRTSNYFFRRDDRNDKDGNTVAIGFDASNTIEAKTSDFKLLPQLVAAAVANGATVISDATYSLSDEKPVTDKARIIAFKNASEEATKAATASGLLLGPITKIAVGAAAVSNLLEGLGGAMSRNSAQFDTSNLNPDLTVDMVHVTYTVTIEYDLK
jgi:uncharacterized protein